MSGLREALMFTPTGRIFPKGQSFAAADYLDVHYSSADECLKQTHNEEYRLSATFHAQCILPDRSDEAKEYTRERLVRHVVEGVFGEFRESLHDLRSNLLHRDIEQALQALDVLEEKMFR